MTELAKEAYELAREAVERSQRALDGLKGHERLCSWRWGILVWLMGTVLAVAFTSLGVLIYDRLPPPSYEYRQY